MGDIFFQAHGHKWQKRRKMAKKPQITADLTTFYSFLDQNQRFVLLLKVSG
jgi:hypothetical protein